MSGTSLLLPRLMAWDCWPPSPACATRLLSTSILSFNSSAMSTNSPLCIRLTSLNGTTGRASLSTKGGPSLAAAEVTGVGTTGPHCGGDGAFTKFTKCCYTQGLHHLWGQLTAETIYTPCSAHRYKYQPPHLGAALFTHSL